jgi:predicted NAD/FAD-dependent oxidoreductase
MDRSAFAVEALRAATKGIIVIDKTKGTAARLADDVDPSDEIDRTAAA